MLFGTSGIRGLYREEVDELLAQKIGNIFAEKLVIIGRDTRITGESLAKAVISGVLSAGKDAIYLGAVPTPTLALATRKLNCNGIQITASHNPSEYNGLKLFSNGLEISRKKEKEIENEYENPIKLAEWDNLGKLKEDGAFITEHKELIKSLVKIKKKLKVVVDPNGVGVMITPDLLRELGCEVITINDSLEGFTRPSEPNKENLRELASKVKEVKADLGIGHDGDADRAVVVDETGDVLALDVQLAIMIEHEAKKGDKIISTAEASLCVRETIEKLGCTSIITPVGSLYLAEMIEKEDAVFGGEPCGEYIFRKGINAPDGILTAAKFAEIASNKKLSELKKKYTTYPILREKFSCKNSEKYEIVKKLKHKIKSSIVKLNKKIRDDDGVRMDEEDGWFLIRASGTEPYIRLTMEYKTKDKLTEKAKELRELIDSQI